MFARECAVLLILLAITSAYDIGTASRYSYETTVAVNEKCVKEIDSLPVGHRLKANVVLTAIWERQQVPKQRLIKIEVLNTKLLVPKKSSFVEHSSELDKITQGTPSFLLLEVEQSKEFWDDPNEHFTLRNLKRGIASLLQFKMKDLETKEDDVSGSCHVIYKAEGKTLRKRKGHCVHPSVDKTLSQPHGVRSASVHYQSVIDYELKDEKSLTISKCIATDYVKTFSNVWHKPSLCINSKSELILEGVEKGQKTYDGKEIENVIEELKKSYEGVLESGNIEAVLVKQQDKKKNLKISVSKLHNDLKAENLVQLKSVIAFYKLLPVFRTATSEEVLSVLEADKFKDIQPQVLDLVSACSTKSCLTGAFEYFGNDKNYNELLERFVVSLSILPRPNTNILDEIKTLLDRGEHDERIRASLLATLGSLLRTYSENHEIADIQIVEDYRIYLETELKKCDEDSESCELSYLRALRNAAFPRSATIFLQYASEGGKLALEAVLGLRNIPSRLLPPENKQQLLNVFIQMGAKQDRSTRSIAAELLLKQQPGPDVLKGILMALSDQSDYEFSTFLTRKLMEMSSADKELRTSIQKLLPEKNIAYYYSLAQEGQSSLFKRPLASMEGTNVTYGLELELLAGAVLKRSVFDISFENAAGGSDLITVGMFAEGLSSFTGGASADDEDDASPTAGMEIGFLGSAFRPYLFFTSTSELMGHAFSGTGSQQTPVFQCILAFSDDEKVVVLNNGMLVRVQLRGILSIDASGSVQVSLWYRTAQSLIKTEGALLMRAAVTVDAGFVSTQGTIQFSGESGVDVKSDFEFQESPFNLCLQMEHPNFEVKFDVHRTVSVSGTKYQLRRTKKRTIAIPGRSFLLHEQNNEMCRAMNLSE